MYLSIAYKLLGRMDATQKLEVWKLTDITRMDRQTRHQNRGQKSTIFVLLEDTNTVITS